jgi:hypothetical protein
LYKGLRNTLELNFSDLKYDPDFDEFSLTFQGGFIIDMAAIRYVRWERVVEAKTPQELIEKALAMQTAIKADIDTLVGLVRLHQKQQKAGAA